jgi:hypothetical protein
MPIYTPDPSGHQFVGGSYGQATTKNTSNKEVSIFGGESGTPFEFCGCSSPDGSGGITGITDGPDGSYIVNAGGSNKTISYELESTGGTINLVGSAGASAGSVNICDLVNDNCDVGTALTRVGRTLYLENGAGGTIDTVSLPADNYLEVTTSIPSGVIVFTDQSGVRTIVDVCDLINGGCPPGYSLALTNGGADIALRDINNNIISSVALPGLSGGGGTISSIANGAGGTYIHDDGLGNLSTIDFNLSSSGGTLNLTGSGGVTTSSINLCSLITSNCNVATSLTRSGYAILLKDGQGDTLSSVTLPKYLATVTSSAPAGTITITDSSGAPTVINVCTLINTACPPGYSLNTSGSSIRLRDVNNNVISTITQPAIASVSTAAGGVYRFDNGLGTTTDIDFNFTTSGGTLNLTGSGGVVTSSVNICSLITSNCNVGTSLSITGGNTLNLVNGAAATISSVSIPVSTITNGAAGVYSFANGVGGTATIDFNFASSGGTLQLTGSGGVVTSSIDICSLITTNCNVATSMQRVGDDLLLKDGQGDTLSTVSILVSNPPVNHGAIAAVPTDAIAQAEYHFWQVNTNSGDVDFTPTVDGELDTPIANAGPNDVFVFTNIGFGVMYFTSTEGHTYTFNNSDILAIVRIGGSDEYRMI